MILVAQFGSANYAILVIYLVILFSIGLVFGGRQKNTQDYFVAGRRVPWIVVAMSMFASLTSAISYMGVPGTAYKENTALIMVGMASVIAAPILSVTIYPIYRRLNVTTSYEYIARRFGPEARYCVSGLFILGRLGWLGTVIYAPALALSVITGINLWLAILLMGVLATAYTVLGGLSAVLWTDMIQFIILVAGAIWVAVTLIVSVEGGLPEIVNVAQQSGHFDIFQSQINWYEASALIVLLSYVINLMGDYGTDQVAVQRLIATKDLAATRRAILTGALFDFFIMSLLLGVGVGLYVYYQQNPQLLPEGFQAAEDSDKILPHFIVQALPIGISGLVITAIFAAAMSSMDSGIHSLSTVVVNDLVKPLRKSPRADADDLRLARFLTFLLGSFAVAVAVFVSMIENILKASSTFLSLFSGPVFALFVLGAMTRVGKFTGWVFGVVLAMLITVWLQRHSWMVDGNEVTVHWIYYYPICFLITFVLGLLFSLLMPGPLADIDDTIYTATKKDGK